MSVTKSVAPLGNLDAVKVLVPISRSVEDALTSSLDILNTEGVTAPLVTVTVAVIVSSVFTFEHKFPTTNPWKTAPSKVLSFVALRRLWQA